MPRLDRARAQRRSGAAEVTIGYQGLPYKATGESNTGIQVSEGVLLHVGAGAEAGYDTNVFYQDERRPSASPIFRTSVFGDVSERDPQRGPRPHQLAFDVRAPAVVYRRYQSNDAPSKLSRTRGCRRPGSH